MEVELREKQKQNVLKFLQYVDMSSALLELSIVRLFML